MAAEAQGFVESAQTVLKYASAGLGCASAILVFLEVYFHKDDQRISAFRGFFARLWQGIEGSGVLTVPERTVRWYLQYEKWDLAAFHEKLYRVPRLVYACIIPMFVLIVVVWFIDGGIATLLGTRASVFDFHWKHVPYVTMGLFALCFAWMVWARKTQIPDLLNVPLMILFSVWVFLALINDDNIAGHREFAAWFAIIFYPLYAYGIYLHLGHMAAKVVGAEFSAVADDNEPGRIVSSDAVFSQIVFAATLTIPLSAIAILIGLQREAGQEFLRLTVTMVTAFFDAATLITVYWVLKRLLVRFTGVRFVFSLFYMLSATAFYCFASAFCALWIVKRRYGFWEENPEQALFNVIGLSNGYEVEASLGPVFWSTHITFIPVMIFLLALILAYIAKCVTIPAYLFVGRAKSHENPLALTAALLGMLAAIAALVPG